MSLPKPEDQGTIQLLVWMLLESERIDSLGTAPLAASAVMDAADKLGYFNSKLLAGPERSADRSRKLSLAEVARLRSVFQQALDAFDDLPPHAFERSEALRVLPGGKP